MLSAIKEEVSRESDLISSGNLSIVPNTFNKHYDIYNNYESSQKFQEINGKISLESKNSRKFLVVGFDPRYFNKVIEEFSKFGKIKKTHFEQNNNFMLLKYEKDYEARNAMKNYNPFFIDKLNKSKIVKVEIYSGKIGKMKLRDKEELSNIDKSGNRSTTIKIPCKSFKEKLYDLFFLFLF